MKIRFFSACLAFVIASSVAIADSRYTANAILADAIENEGKEVKLDVVSVRPMRWKSPIPELTFFQAMTYDRWDNKPGGAIIVAVDSAEAERFTDKYGVGRDGRSTDTLKGILISGPGRDAAAGQAGEKPQRLKAKAAGPRGAQRGGGVWIVDATGGKALDLIKDREDLSERFGEETAER